MAALTIVLRTRRKDDRGRAPARLQIAHRSTRFIGLGLKAEVEKWNSGKERVRRPHPDAEEINAFLSKLETTALSVLSELNRAGKMLMAGRIKDAIQERRGASTDAEDFLAFAREQLGTYRAYMTSFRKFKAFIEAEYGREKVPFNALDARLFHAFRTYLLRDLRQQTEHGREGAERDAHARAHRDEIEYFSC